MQQNHEKGTHSPDFWEFSFHTMSFLPLNKKDKLTKVQLRSLLLVTLTTTAPAVGSGIIHWYYH